MSYIGNIPLVADATTPITNSLSDNGVLFSADTTGYNSISIQLSGDWQALCTFQVSNDNSFWANVQGYTFNNYLNSTNTAQDNGVYIFPVTGRYFQVVVSNYKAGTVATVTYLRSQSLAGIGETMLTQSMDDATGIAQNVKFPSSLLGQQTTRTSLPVALANEQINDLHIVGRTYSTANGIPVNTNLMLDNAIVTAGANFANSNDCLQYRSVSLQFIQTSSVSSGSVIFEASNDNINWISYPIFSSAAGNYGTQTSTFNFGTGSGSNNYYEGPLVYRYFRARLSGAVSGGTGTIQCTARLSMNTYSPKFSQNSSNITQLAGSGLASAGGAAGAPPLPVGGVDSANITRRVLTDTAGAISVTGAPATTAEYYLPIQVQTARTTRGQESLNDNLAQILIELRALNHYIRELPTAIAAMSQFPNPEAMGSPQGMQDEPESLYRDDNVLNNRRG